MNADDIKWINQFIDDSKGEPGATPAIARKYCICMNEKMDDNETQSITQRPIRKSGRPLTRKPAGSRFRTGGRQSRRPFSFVRPVHGTHPRSGHARQIAGGNSRSPAVPMLILQRPDLLCFESRGVALRLRVKAACNGTLPSRRAWRPRGQPLLISQVADELHRSETFLDLSRGWM